MNRLTASQLFFSATNGIYSRARLVELGMEWISMDESGDVFCFEKEPERDEFGEWVCFDGGEVLYVGIVFNQVLSDILSSYPIKIDSSFLDDYEIDGKVIKAADKYESEGDAF